MMKAIGKLLISCLVCTMPMFVWAQSGDFGTIEELAVGIDNVQTDNVHIAIEASGTYLKINRPWKVIDCLEIVDLNGRFVLREKAFSSEAVNVSSLTQGVYILKLTKDNKPYMYKFIKG